MVGVVEDRHDCPKRNIGSATSQNIPGCDRGYSCKGGSPLPPTSLRGKEVCNNSFCGAPVFPRRIRGINELSFIKPEKNTSKDATSYKEPPPNRNCALVSTKQLEGIIQALAVGG